MPFEKAITSLQEIEGRIRRMFRSAGNIGATWKPDLTPVMIAGDLTSPGASDLRGRRFMATVYVAAPGANTLFGWKAQTDIVIDSLFCDATTTGLASWMLYGPEDADPTVNMLSQNTFWCESSRFGDAAPLLNSNAMVAGTNGNVIRRNALKAAAGPSVQPVGIFIPQNGKIAIHSSVVSTDLVASFTGRVF